MDFTNIEFYIFLLIFLAFFWMVPIKNKLLVLTISSALFYVIGEVKFFYLIFLVGLCDYWIGNRLVNSSYARAWLGLACAKSVLILVIFKYSVLDVTNGYLPLGLSFFMFQSLGYVIDVYMKRVQPAPGLLSYSGFLLMFPQLIAGPICRANELLDQVRNPEKVDAAKIYAGLVLLIQGLFKKVVIADYLAQFVDLAFGDVNRISHYQYWILATVSFSVQIYFDFSAYTDIARGLGKLMGIELPQNFQFPYHATSLQQFWRRWHMTLSRWFRDYIYIPLGGSLQSGSRTIFAILITFILSGAWHGGGLNFAFWGLYHGLFLLIERTGMFKAVPLALKWLSTMLVVQIGWILFRAPDMQSFWIILTNILTLNNDGYSFSLITSFNYVYLVLGLAILTECWQYSVSRNKKWTEKVELVIYPVMLLACIFFYAESKTFIYFRF